MKKPSGYERREESSYRSLPAGGYVCKILQAKERETRNGDPMVVVIFDIAEGEYEGFFTELWKDKKSKSDEPNLVKYPNDGIGYIVTSFNGEPSKSFNNFCSSVENSGYPIDWDEDESGTRFCNSLKEAEVGVVFGRVENEWNGKTFWQTKPSFYRSVDSIRSGRFTIPSDRPLTKSGVVSSLGFSETDENIPF